MSYRFKVFKFHHNDVKGVNKISKYRIKILTLLIARMGTQIT